MAETTAKRIVFPPGTQLIQDQSPLLWKLPLEVQREIFSYALTDYEDLTNPYSLQTCYRRPEYFGPRRTHTALLQTCQRVYNEAWSMPWLNAQQTFFLAWPSRSPPRKTTIEAMQEKLQDYHSLGADTKVLNVQVFAQLCELSSCLPLQRILNMNHFKPRTITLTIRHTDFWSWESDANLYVNERWVDFCQFPESLQEFRIQFESLERKKEQIDIIASEAVEKWIFQRKDNFSLRASPNIEISRWSGCSTWENMRWLRDEIRPEELDYYIATVSWFPSKEPRAVTFQAPQLAMPRDFPRTIFSTTPGKDKVHIEILQPLQIAPGTSAAEVVKLVEEYYGANFVGWCGPQEFDDDDYNEDYEDYNYYEEDSDESTSLL